VALLLASCTPIVIPAQPTSLPSPTLPAEPSATPAPSSTPEPTATATPEPSPTPQPTPLGGGGEWIAFSRVVDSVSDIFIIRRDGTELTKLTDDPKSDVYPRWSPDGSKILFTSDRDGKAEIYVMNADGSEQTRLTHTQDTGGALYASWSPDGSRIIFAVFNAYNGLDLATANSDGSNFTMLTIGENNAFAVWSPDGSKLAYVSYDIKGVPDIIIAEADGSNPVGLNVLKTALGITGAAAQIGVLNWSPDGRQLVFTITPGDIMVQSALLPYTEIFSINADGTQPVQLTQSEVREYNPCWSPDGNQIYYNADVDSGSEIFRMNADGTGIEMLFTLGGINLEPAIQPIQP
jgi:Tol biopolymer transport system component